MAVVEDKRMAQTIGPQIKGGIFLKRFVKQLVYIKGAMEILPDFSPLLFRITLIQDDGAGFAQFHK